MGRRRWRKTGRNDERESSRPGTWLGDKNVICSVRSRVLLKCKYFWISTVPSQCGRGGGCGCPFTGPQSQQHMWVLSSAPQTEIHRAWEAWCLQQWSQQRAGDLGGCSSGRMLETALPGTNCSEEKGSRLLRKPPFFALRVLGKCALIQEQG